MKKVLFRMATLILALIVTLLAVPELSTAASATQIDGMARLALDQLCRINPTAKQLSERAKGILVFPGVLKAGLIFGGQYGEGR